MNQLSVQRCSGSALRQRRLTQGVLLGMLLVVSGCGSDGSDASNASNASNELNPSGSVNFAIQLEPLQRQEIIPQGSNFSCEQNRVTKIRIRLVNNLNDQDILDKDGNPIQQDFDCHAHEGRLEGVVVGGDRKLSVTGVSSSIGLSLYEGESKPFNVVFAGESKDVGVVPIRTNVKQLNQVAPLKLEITPAIIKILEKADVKLTFQDENGRDLADSTQLSEFKFNFNQDVVSINGAALTGLAVGETEVTATYVAGLLQIPSNKVKVIIERESPINFTLNATPPAQKVNRGQSVQYTVRGTLIGPPSLLLQPQTTAQLSVPNCPGVPDNCSLNPSSINLRDQNSSSVLTVKTDTLQDVISNFTIQGVVQEGSEKATRSTPPLNLEILVQGGTVRGFLDHGAGSIVTVGEKSTTVDPSGFWALTDVPVGAQTVTVNAGGGGTFTRETIVQQGGTSDIGSINPEFSPKTISTPIVCSAACRMRK